MTDTLPSSQVQATLSRLWHVLESGGLPPYKAIEQISYLLVLKQMELRGEHAHHIRWSGLHTIPEEKLVNVVSEALAKLRDASGISLFERAQLSISKAPLLRETMLLIDELFAPTDSPEQHAHVYDALLSMAEEAARAWAAPGGKFYTPHHIAHLLCSLVRPQPLEKVCDYACGNGRLLAAASVQIARICCDPDELRFAADGQPLPSGEFQWTDDQRDHMSRTRLVGMDIDESATLQAWVLLHCLGIEHPVVHTIDTLSNQLWDCLPHNDGHVERFDVLLANPPYSARVDGETLDVSLRSLRTLKAEWLFVGRALQLLRPGGRAAIVVPDSVLFHQSKAAVVLRQRLITEHGVHALISLPAGAFAPHTDIKTSILVLTHSGQTDTIWCYDVEHDGYTLDKRRRPAWEQNDLPDLMIKYSLRFADTLSSCRPSAFIDGDTELQWSNIEETCRSYHKALPLIRQDMPGGVPPIFAFCQ